MPLNLTNNDVNISEMGSTSLIINKPQDKSPLLIGVPFINEIKPDRIEIKRSLAHGTSISSNYDPFDKSQTDMGIPGEGATGIIMTNKMVAVGRKLENGKPQLPFGTVIRIPELNQEFLVADIKNGRYVLPEISKEVHIDFATPYQKKNIIQKFNKPYKIEIVEIGKGRRDAQLKANKFQ